MALVPTKLLRVCFSGVFCLVASSIVFTTRAIAALSTEVVDYAVQISAQVQKSPAQISLSWQPDIVGKPLNYTVYRRLASSNSWGTGAILSGSATTYTDTSVSLGTAYEYQIKKTAASYTAYGYLRSGIEVPGIENRGTLLLLVDSTLAPDLTVELTQLTQDLVGDGWKVLRHDVGRDDSVTSVKALIKADYLSDPINVNTVLLLGHVPVPRSGVQNPDGHDEHNGAWPADVYYADMTGNWTDATVNFVQSISTIPSVDGPLTNIPGDGKFDQTIVPGSVSLQIGRVDFSNLPGRTSKTSPPTFVSELELTRQYLIKDHRFRHGKQPVQRRAIIADYFGVLDGWSFAASGFRSFAPLVGPGQILNINEAFPSQTGKWMSTLSANPYLLAYGCGSGRYSYADGLGSMPNNFGTSYEMVAEDIQTVFLMLYGSWFGEWDHEDNLLRAALAAKSYTLASVWSGTPHWFLHPMGMGETIGYCARLAQNNTTQYQNFLNPNANGIHIALMGDPTLRLHPVVSPTNLTANFSSNRVALQWTASADSVLGYNVYRSPTLNGPWVRINSSIVTATSFTDANAPSTAVQYSVRAVKLESSPSGSYFNLSQAAFASVVPPLFTVQPASQTVANGQSVSFTSSALNATNYQWKKDGVLISGATANTLSISNLSAADAGTYTVVASNLSGNSTSSDAVLRVETPVPGFLGNLSARVLTGDLSSPLIAGFVVSNASPKSLLIRGIGPGLRPFGVSDPLADPSLTLYRGTAAIAVNDNWEDGGQGSTVVAADSRLGAFALLSGSNDAALVTTISGGTNFTVVITGKSQTQGVALAELYDAYDHPDSGPLINMSSRGLVGTGGSSMIAGFVITGNVPKQILVRGIGPTLADFGVSNSLEDPQLDLHANVSGEDKVLTCNDNWSELPNILATMTSAFEKAGAFLLPSNSRDASLLVTLVPGNYTAILSGVGNSTGVALIEIYDVNGRD